MHIGIHTGASGHFGLGHAVRCKALASALIAQGATVEFLTQTPALAAFVAPLPCHLYRHVWPEWPIDVLVEDVPCQRLDAWYASLRQRYRVVRVDVPAATPETCDLLIAPCAHWHPDVVQGLSAAFGDRLLYGLDYVLLEEAVTQMPRVPYIDRIEGPVVFCAGGSDPGGALRTLAVFAGRGETSHERIALVPQYATGTGLPQWLRKEPFSRDWLGRAALVVSMWGVTCYETLWLGTPTITVVRGTDTGEDAQRLANASHHAIRYVNMLGTPDPGTLSASINALCTLPDARLGMAAASVGLLDGLGAQRAASAILALED